MANNRAEKTLGESTAPPLDDALFEDAFDYAPHALAVLAADGTVLRANRSFCQMLGLSRAELQALNWLHIIHPEDLPTEREQRRRLASADIGRYELVLRCVRKDGEPIWVRLAVCPTFRAIGRPANLIAAADRVASPVARAGPESDDQWLRHVAEAALAAVHEIGNCLTPLMLNTEMILEHAKKTELRESTHQIFKSARRIAFALRRLRGVEDPPCVAYVGENRMLDLRLLAPPTAPESAGSGEMLDRLRVDQQD